MQIMFISKIPVEEKPFTKLGVLHCRLTETVPTETLNLHAWLVVSLGVAIIMVALLSAKAPQHVPHYYRKLYVHGKLHGDKLFC